MSWELAFYTFVEQIAEDDRFRLIRGVDTRDGSAVVLKQLRRPADFGRLESELTMIRSLPMAGVVRALGIVNTSGAPSLVLADSGGATLQRHIAAGRIALDAKLKLAVDLTAIVDTIHRAGVVNRNLRPSTILWNARDDRLEIMDFSLATRATRDLASLSLPVIFVGTAHYVAPEQTGRLDLVVDRRSDLYALGATLYHLFTGRPPFEGDDIAALLHAHMARVPERADHLVADLPPIVASILAKLLRKDPDDRYQTASGLAADLRRARDGGPSFELGDDDATTVLRIREALVGREVELARLEVLTRELAAGRRVIAYISGESGAGKTALGLELARSVVTKGGVYARGKFDLAIVTTPYSAVAQLLETLASTLLALPSDALEALRDRLDASACGLAPALVDVFPAVRPLFRKIGALETVSPDGSRNRLIASFLAFIGALLPSHVMTVLAVDDLQWADDASLTLLEALVQDPSLTALGLVVVARDHEIVPASRVARFLASLEATGAEVDRIALSPLEREAVATILADSLHTTTERVDRLSQLVWEKTRGNPFFVRALLESAVAAGFIRYESGFVWDVAALAASPVAENVATLLAERLRDLPEATREALTIAARIGAPIEGETVARMLGVDEARLLEILGPAIERGMVLCAGTAIRFAHDRLVEAALALASPERATAIHAKLSAVLLEGSDESRFFEAVDHLALSGDPDDEDARAHHASLALAAARRAHDARAFGAAERYFEHYAATMDPRSFSDDFDTTFDAHLAWAEAAFLAGSYQRAEQLFEQLERRASDPNAYLRVRRIVIRYYETTNRFDDAIRLSFATLADVGVVLPDYDVISPGDIQAEVGRFLELFGQSGAGNIPLCSSSTTREAISMLVDVAVPLWSARVDALPYVVARAGILSLEEGLAPATGVCLVVLGSMLCIALGDATVGAAVAKLGLEVQERVGSADYEGFTRYAYFAMVQFHSESARLGRDGLLSSYHRSLALGSRRWASAAMDSYPLRGALIGLPLSKVAEQVADGRSALLRLGQEGSLTFFEALRHFVERILEREETPWDLGSRRTDATSAIAHFKASNHGGLIALHTTLSMLELLVGGDDQAAYAIAKEEQEQLLQPRGQLQTELGIALFALVSARCAPAGDATADAEIARAAERFERSARFEATSFGGYHALVEAARLDRAGAFDVASVACDRAIDIFERDSVLHLSALANELAARIHRRAGRARTSRFYQEAAHHAYQRWGAPRAIRRLEGELGLVASPPPDSPSSSEVRAGTQVDLVSLLKATRAIASEIELDHLITTLLRIVAENAGANRAFLFVDHDGALELEARCDAELVVSRALPGERVRGPGAPFAIATLVARTHEILVHERASIVPQLASDPYLARRGSVALLAAPIERLGKVAGVVVLENDLVAGAFTAHHAEVVTALNAQIAVALENAGLYEALRVRAASLAVSEQRFRMLSEHSLVGIYVMQDRRFAYVNPSLARIVGYPPVELLEMDPLALVHPDDRDFTADEMERRLAGTLEGEVHEIRGRRRDGETLYLEIMGFVGEFDGRPAVIGNVVDVTARRAADERLRESEERFRKLTENSLAGIYIAQDERYVYANPAFERILGVEPGTLAGADYMAMVHPDDRDGVRDRVRERTEGETTAVHYELRMLRSDGTIVWLEVLGSRTLYQGRPAVFGNALDITERKAAEAARRASEARFRAAFMVGPDAMSWASLRDGRLLEVNERFEETFACTREEALGMSSVELGIWENPSERAELVAELRARGFVRDRELRGRRKDGSSFVAAYSGRIVRQNGEDYLLGLVRDISDRKRQEEVREQMSYELDRHRRHLEDLVAQRTEELRKARDAADAANHAKSRFLANMSHEIRTPMNAVLGFTSLLLRDSALTRDQRRYLETINRAGDHLMSLIDDILQLAKVESGFEVVVERDLDLWSFVEDIGLLFRARAIDKGLALVIDRDPSVPRFIRIDDGKLRQILSNLLGNAIKFTSAGTVAIRLRASCDCQRLFVEVEDTGAGIRSDELQRLFQKFEQTATGRASLQGTGLGLAISRELVTLLGGVIGVESQPDTGSVFRFDIPISESTELDAIARVEERLNLRLAPDESPKRILIVDDVEDNRTLLVSLLDLVGFETRSCADGRQAVAEVEAWRPHLVVMDLRMPGMDGIEATRRIRGGPGGDAIAVICVSASAFPDEERVAIEMGADRFLGKPFRESALLVEIGALLGVHYIDTRDAVPAEPLMASAVARLPSELRRDLLDATRRGDLDAMLGVLDAAAAHDVALASALRDLAERFAYKRVIELLEAS